MLSPGSCEEMALVETGRQLRRHGYRFVTPTPATHSLVNARSAANIAVSLEDVFGWNRPFERSLLPAGMVELLARAGALRVEGRLIRSAVRFSTLQQLLLVHSGFPTLDHDAVFFGPDTYRFVRFVKEALDRNGLAAPVDIIDVGCGTGAAGIFLRTRFPGAGDVTLTDISPKALRYAWVNARLAGMSGLTLRQGDLYEALPGEADLIVANPPYLRDAHSRLYRDGGGALGSALSLRIVREGLPRLRAGGLMILYTGAPVVAGRDTFLEALGPILASEAAAGTVLHSYEELDPDVFGDELRRAQYSEVDRIAAVGLVIQRPAG
jgi:release factor glutamine methyltransferase